MLFSRYLLSRTELVILDLVLQDDPAYMQALRARNPETRLRIFLKACQTKRVCEHTGQKQPKYRLDGMRILAEFDAKGGDEEMEGAPEAERKFVSAN